MPPRPARVDTARVDTAARRDAARIRRITVVIGSVLVLLAVATAALFAGASGLPASGVVRALVDAVPFVDVEQTLSTRQAGILWQIRMPRVVLGMIVGATLAVAGVAYQGVFRNPLADPYLLGVSSGAGLGATIAIVLGASGALAVGVPVAAFAGALAAVTATYLLGTSVSAGRSEVVIVLAGVAVAAFANAIQTYLMQSRDDTLRAVYSWMLGRLSTDGWVEVVRVLPYVVVATLVVFAFRGILDVMAVGDLEAASLGIAPERVRLIVIAAATLGTAAVVSVSGLIGFVGIVVPHAVRLVLGPGHRLLVPVSMIVGAAFLVACDVLARASMAELPIGVVTAAIGAPFFLVVLRRGRGVAR